MHARVVRFEGGEADAIRANAEEIDRRSEEGPPPGVPAVALLMLIDPDNGRSMSVTLYKTEEDMRAGDETLNSMSPPSDGMGKRAAVEMYEVATERRV
jgi:hypothetical protein